MKNFRFWFLKKLFTEDEKYLIIRAIEDRINKLENISINEKWADKEHIKTDCVDLSGKESIFNKRILSKYAPLAQLQRASHF